MNASRLRSCIAALLLALLLIPAAYAREYAVDGHAGLESAIEQANATSGPDSIVLDGDIVLQGALPPITSELTIEGNSYTIDGGEQYRIFLVNQGKLTLNDLTLSRGKAQDGGAFDREKRAFFIAGSVIPGNPLAETEYGVGGAILVYRGELHVSGSAFLDNQAVSGGGILNFEGDVTIRNSRFSGDSQGKDGGAIGNLGKLVISDSQFLDNAAATIGGAIGNLGELTVDGSVFRGNSAKLGGAIGNHGGMFRVSDSVFESNRAQFPDGTGQGGAIYNIGNAQEITNSAFADNLALEAGGAIYVKSGEIALSDVSLTRNQADVGKSIFVENGSASMTMNGPSLALSIEALACPESSACDEAED